MIGREQASVYAFDSTFFMALHLDIPFKVFILTVVLTTACHIQMVTSCPVTPRAQIVMGQGVVGVNTWTTPHKVISLNSHIPVPLCVGLGGKYWQ